MKVSQIYVSNLYLLRWLIGHFYKTLADKHLCRRKHVKQKLKFLDRFLVEWCSISVYIPMWTFKDITVRRKITYLLKLNLKLKMDQHFGGTSSAALIWALKIFIIDCVKEKLFIIIFINKDVPWGVDVIHKMRNKSEWLIGF